MKLRPLNNSGRARGKEISQDQLLREGDHDNIDRQFLYGDHILVLCCMAALNNWDKINKEKKRSLIKLYKAQQKPSLNKHQP